jgi:hypothetical protein
MELDYRKMGGVIDEIRETDYMKGAIPYEKVCENWTNYLPKGERQNAVYMDAMACVTFSATNIIETQLNHQLANGKLSQGKIEALKELGYIVDGQFDFSDRFTAKMSGTTDRGNSFQNVWDSIRHDGLLPERDWAYPVTQRTPVFDWADYYAEIPQALKDKAKKIFDYIEVPVYEWVFCNNVVPLTEDELANLRKEMFHAPIHFATPVCNWSKTPCTPCGKYESQHATMGYDITGNINIEDSYPEYLKQLSRDYIIRYALKGVVKVKQTNNEIMTNSKLVKNGNEWGFFDPASNEVGLIDAGRHRGVEIPQAGENKVDWAKLEEMCQGELTIKK